MNVLVMLMKSVDGNINILLMHLVSMHLEKAIGGAELLLPLMGYYLS